MIIWQDILVPIKNPNATIEESYHIQDASFTADYDHMCDIMDAK